MPGRERGRLRIGGKKRLGRWCIKLQLTSPPTKWWTNTDGHESSTETGFFSLHQRFAFPHVWATVIHGTGVPVPPHARLPSLEVMKRRSYKRKMARWSPNDLPVKLPWGGKMGSCSLDHGCPMEHPLRMGKNTGKMIWLQTSEGTCTYGREMTSSTHWCWQIVNPKMNPATHCTGSRQARPNKN